MQVTSESILKSGWGIFLAVAGVVSIFLDAASPSLAARGGQSISVFGPGSFSLGWLFIALVIVGPAIVARSGGLAPIHKLLAFGCCGLAYFAWAFVHGVIAGEDRPLRMNLSFVAGLVLCWRLLTWPKEFLPPTPSASDRYFYRTGPNSQIQGPSTLAEIRASITFGQNCTVVLATGQSSFALKNATWSPLPNDAFPQSAGSA